MPLLTYKRLPDKRFILNDNSRVIDILISDRTHFYTFSARGGIELLIEHLKLNEENRITLLPAFSAQGVVLPFQRKKAKYLFYECDERLGPDLNDIIQKIKLYNVKAIFVIHYFGFPQQMEPIMEIAKQNEIYVFEDCAQAFLSSSTDNNFLGAKGHISFFSLTKFLPVPDGSLFIINDPEIDISKLRFKKSFILKKTAIISSRISIYVKGLQTKIIKKNNLIFDLTAKFFNLIYYKIICHLSNPQKISSGTLNLLNHYDLKSFISNRIRNAKFYDENLNLMENQKFYNFDGPYVISGFPIIVKNRDRLKKELKKQNIETLAYTHNWFCVSENEKSNFEHEKYILDHHLLLPVNENYSLNDIAQITEVVNKYLKKIS